MNFTKPVLVFASFLMLGLSTQQKGGWRGIIPLHSTRADIERILGPSRDKCRCIYKTENESVYVDFARAPCKGNLSGWNVPTDTVLRFTVSPEAPRSFSDLNLDLTKYDKSFDDTLAAYYANRDEGIQYEVSDSGVIAGITYIPRTSDENLRCAGSVVEDGRHSYSPFDSYSGITFKESRFRLDIFAIELQKRSGWIGYIIVYGRQRQAKAHGAQAKKYLVDKRRIPSPRVVTTDGGYRRALTVDLYLLPPGALPPISTPFVRRVK